MSPTQIDPTDAERILQALTAYSNGDFNRLLPEDMTGTAGEVARTFNHLAAETSYLISEINRIAREVSEGKFGGQGEVPSASGGWKEMLDLINKMSSDLTCQVRGINRYTWSATQGKDPLPPLPEAQGETAELYQLVVTLAGQRTAA